MYNDPPAKTSAFWHVFVPFAAGIVLTTLAWNYYGKDIRQAYDAAAQYLGLQPEPKLIIKESPKVPLDSLESALADSLTSPDSTTTIY